jgi:uncharacterized metal-binding protein YceD (DUF177 family)
MSVDQPWSVCVTLPDVQRGARIVNLEPDAPTRAKIAKMLDLVELNRLTARVEVSAYFDGAQINGSWTGAVVQTCGITLEPFETALHGAFQVHCVPHGSPLIIEPENDVEVDLGQPDPPDILENDSIDVAHYVVEHLALEIDPFPRKPGAAFEPRAPENPQSPFAVLARRGGSDPKS